MAEKFRDHPRTCGEQSNLPGHRSFRPGSPPHMRGTVDIGSFLDFEQGITPAHAGNSHTHSVTYTPLRDHPRTCGEQSMRVTADMMEEGSPPHMRGTD